jgi:hypothetical protein
MTARGPAILRRARPGWIHATHPDNVPAIVERGLLVEPPRRTYGPGHALTTLGGIYVVDAERRNNLLCVCAEYLG